MNKIMNRSVSAALALLGAYGMSAAQADPPAAGPSAATVEARSATATSATTATSAITATAATTATTATAATTATTAAPSGAESDAALEKRLTNSGYRSKMRNGTKVWCKREAELGSRLGGQEVCGTPDELRMVEQQQQDSMKDIQKLYDHKSN
jgi:hypothetical protein